MSDQTSLVTTAARNAAAANAADYTGAVAQHISGDYGQHNQVNPQQIVFPTTAIAPGAPYGPHFVPNSWEIRFLVTVAGIDYSIVVPGFPVGAYTGGGTNQGGADQSAPVFSAQPQSGQFPVGTNVTISVAVQGTPPVFLQWTLNGTAIDGATGATLNFPSFSASNAGNYVCIATNGVGQTLSATAALAIQNTQSGTGTPSRPGISGGCFTRNTLVTLQNGIQQPISSIVRGDVLRTYDLKGLNPNDNESWKKFAESKLEATVVSTTVTAVLKSSFPYFYRINNELEPTLEHPLLAKHGANWLFVQTKDIKVGDYLFKNGQAVPVKSIAQVNTPVEVWNLDVAPYDLYLANGYVVHNATLIQKL